MSDTTAILTTLQQRQADKARRAQPANRSRKRGAKDPGGLHAEERSTATTNESARQSDEVTDIARDNAPSTWKRSTALEAPEPRSGFTQRWVRIKMAGQDDTENYDRYMEEGWRPRDPKTVPRRHSLTTSQNHKHAQMIVKRGHVLMEMKNELVEQRRKFYQGALDRQHKAMENELYKDNTGAAGRVMPLTDATVKSRAALARRRSRSAAADD